MISEIIVEVLPRLYQIKYASGTLEELLYVDVPREHYNASGQLVLDYAKAVQESVFQRMRIVREGHLRVVFNPDLKVSAFIIKNALLCILSCKIFFNTQIFFL